MASAMATTVLALPWLQNKKHILVFAVAEFIHHQRTFTVKPRRESQDNNLNALCRENLLNANTYASLLQDCNNMKKLKQIHAHILIHGHDQNILLETKLVNSYAMCFSLENACRVFDKICKPNVFLWNAMIRGYAKNGLCEELLTFYYQMQLSGVQPDNYTFPFVLKACIGLASLRKGKEIHCHIITRGLEVDAIVGTALVDMYAKCGSPEIARHLFDKMPERDVVSWNAMIAGYAQNGHANQALILFHEMQLADVSPNSVTILSVIPACSHLAALKQGEWVHSVAIKSGLDLDVSLENALIDMYAKCKNVNSARQLFDQMSKRDVVSWSAMIGGYAQNGHANEALALFYQMQLTDAKPNVVTLVSVLVACADLAVLQQGKEVHVYIIKHGFESDVSVGTTLVSMYAKCRRMDIARLLFDKMATRDVVSWSAMIAGYTQNGYANEALTLFYEMPLADVKPNRVSIVSVLPAFADLADLQEGKDIHDYIIKNGFESDVSVRTALIAMYAKSGSIEIARQLFDKMSKRDVVSWNAMIAAYAQNGYINEALTLFHQMQEADMQPDSITMVSVLPACAHLAALQQGKRIHEYIIRSGFESDVSVQNALLDMYAKCGSVDIACQLFQKISERDEISWNAMIAGYTQNGLANKALTLFHQMHMEDVTPNLVTMVSVLPACAHLAALQESKWIHAYIIRSGFESDVSVVNALVDAYAKCGRVEFARQLFDSISKRDVISWNAMIAGYGMHGHGKDALALFNQMQLTDMKPDHITFMCVLSACRHAGFVDAGQQVFVCMSRDYCITPRAEHYACVVDLLGRAGRLDEAHDFIKKMPLKPDAGVWGALLGACRVHCNIELGEHVSECLLELEPTNPGHYILLSNIYAAAGRWDDAAKVRKVLKDQGLKKIPGCSWIEIKNRVHAFLVGDKSHPQSEEIYAVLESLGGQMKEEGYAPDTSFALHNVEDEEKESSLSCHSEKLAIVFGLINTNPGARIQITKNLRVCGDCHSATKFISKIVRREIVVRDANRFHHFKDGLCSCGDYW
eukprot:Gb_04533 [translate_table: standard]